MESITPEPIQEPVSVDDNAGSLTVDAAALPLPTGAATAANQATIIGHIDGIEGILTTIDADTGVLAAAVTAGKVQVDVVTSALPSGAATAANQTTIIGHVDGIEALLTTIDADTSNLSVVGGGLQATAIRVTIASDSTGVIGIGSIAAGDNNIGNVDIASIAAGDNNIGNVDVVTLPNVTLAAGTNTNEVVGDVAQDAAVAGNPVLVGARASTAVPTAMSADGDAVYPWANRSGALVVGYAPHVALNGSPWTLLSETAQYTTTQTSAVLVAGGVSDKIVVTHIQIQVGGTTAGTLQVYFGTGAYSRGTDEAIFDGEFAPSATLKPGFSAQGPFIAGAAGDDILVTTSAAINPLTITVWYYVVT